MTMTNEVGALTTIPYTTAARKEQAKTTVARLLLEVRHKAFRFVRQFIGVRESGLPLDPLDHEPGDNKGDQCNRTGDVEEHFTVTDLRQAEQGNDGRSKRTENQRLFARGLENDPDGAARQPDRGGNRHDDRRNDGIAPGHGAEQADHDQAGGHDPQHRLFFRVHADAVDDPVDDGMGDPGCAKHFAQAAAQHDDQADQRQK